ncbi:hypothetical protein [Mesorhizobium sp. A556]
MVTKAKKPAAKKTASVQSKTGAGAAIAERSRDAAKPAAFGKAAPRKVTPAQKSAAPAAKPASRSAKGSKNSDNPSLATKIAQVATGAVVATAKLAASVVGKGGEGKSKTK